MSTIVISNIKATGETASRAVSGVAAAWVNFNGTGTIAARDSNNVSSLTDGGTGDYTINFSNSMANANYAFPVGTGGIPTTDLALTNFNYPTDTTAPTSSSIRGAMSYVNATTNRNNFDSEYITGSFHGDLA